MLMFKTIRKWWSAWGTLPVISWVKAAAFYKAGQFEAAKLYYEKGLQRYPQHPASQCARMDLSYCLFRIKNFVEAEKHLRIVLNESPDNKEAVVRLARLHLWTGNYLEAAWTLRRGLEHISSDPELVGLFVLASAENSGPAYMISAAKAELSLLGKKFNNVPMVLIAKARLAFFENSVELAANYLEPVLRAKTMPLDAYILNAQILLAQDKVAHARKVLRRGIQLAPENPRLLCLMAQTYTLAGPFYEPDYACQLATAAAQNSGWLSPWAMHVLAESYYHRGDNMSALIIAGKAKEVGSQRLGAYRNERSLDRLIESLSQGTIG